VKDMPRREIGAIRGFLDPRWHGMMEWPMKKAQENVPNGADERRSPNG
jgi:hypothetical protein